ncbi:MAG: hypothetical protein U0359_15845 [Byssovorax sp.]
MIDAPHRACRIPRRLGAISLVALTSLAACAPATRPPAAPAAPAAPPDMRWHRVISAVLGASFELPGVPEEHYQKTKRAVFYKFLLASRDKAGPTYQVGRLDMDIHDRAADAVALQNVAKGEAKRLGSVTREDARWINGYHAMEIDGTTKEGLLTRIRFMLVGRSLYSLEVDAEPGHLDADDAERFFGSFQPAIPFRVHPIPELRCTVAVPASAMEMTPELPQPVPGMIMRYFHLGGDAERGYAIGSVELEPALLARATTEQLLASIVKGIAGQGAIQGRPVSIAFEGESGVEILFRPSKDEETPIRVQIFILGNRLYELITSGKRADVLDDALARRFFSSFRPSSNR